MEIECLAGATEGFPWHQHLVLNFKNTIRVISQHWQNSWKIPVNKVIFGLSDYRPAALLDMSSFTGCFLIFPLLGTVILRKLSEGLFPNVYQQIATQLSFNFVAYFPFSIHITYLPITALIWLEKQLFFKQNTHTENSFVCNCGFMVHFVVLKLLIWHKEIICKAFSVMFHQTRWYNKRILRERYSVPQGFS